VGSVLSSNAPYFFDQTGLDSQTIIMLVQIGVSMGVVSALAKSLGFGTEFRAVAGTLDCCHAVQVRLSRVLDYSS
jgi:hypothetical protein